MVDVKLVGEVGVASVDAEAAGTAVSMGDVAAAGVFCVEAEALTAAAVDLGATAGVVGRDDLSLAWADATLAALIALAWRDVPVASS